MRNGRVINVGGIELALFVSEGLAARLGSIRRRLSGRKPVMPPSRIVQAEHREHLTPEQRSIYDRISGTEWYHSIDLGHGIVTPGFFDHRPVLHEYRLPESLEGKRVLDVATFDGFWAFELERRGAREVVSIDLSTVADTDLAPSVRAAMSQEELDTELGTRFKMAKEILGSGINRQEISVYDLSPERLGKFDFVFCGDLLIHLKCPIRALEAIGSIAADTAYFVELYEPPMSMGTNRFCNYHGGAVANVWWSFSEEILRQMIRNAGFAQVETLNHFNFRPTDNSPSPPHVLFKATAAQAT